MQDFGDDHIKFVGVSSEAATVVKPFLEKMGEDMQYSVALDESNSLADAYPRKGGRSVLDVV